MYIYPHICILIYKNIQLYISIHMYVCECICPYLYLYTYIPICKHPRTHAFILLYLYKHVHIYVYSQTHMYVQSTNLFFIICSNRNWQKWNINPWFWVIDHGKSWWIFSVLSNTRIVFLFVYISAAVRFISFKHSFM